MAPAFVHLICTFFSSGGFWFVVVAGAGAILGIYLFWSGFRKLRFKRMILNTPLSRIRGASIGLVEVNGTPTGPSILTAPVTGDPCFYYRVQAWQWTQSGDKHAWKSVLEESLYVPFFLEDSTGRVLVDPQGADMDVHRSFVDEVGASLFRTPELVPPHLRDFLVKRGLVPYDKIKIEEHIIREGFPLFVFGTLGENITGNSWLPRPHFDASSTGGLNFSYDGGSGFRIMFNLSSNLGNRPGSGAAVLMDQFSRLAVNQGEANRYSMPGGSVQTAAVERTLTDAKENPFHGAALRANNSMQPSLDKSAIGAFDLRPSAAISKGERNEPFTISWHSQREIVGKLAWQSAASIWGGPLLTLISIWFLKGYFEFVW